MDPSGAVGRWNRSRSDVSGSAASRARASASSGEMAPDPCSRLVMGGPPVVGWSQRRVASGDDRPSRPDPCPGPACGGGALGRGAGRRLCGVRRQRRTLGRRAICGRHERGHGGAVRRPERGAERRPVRRHRPDAGPVGWGDRRPGPDGRVRDRAGLGPGWDVHDGHGQGRDREAGGGVAAGLGRQRVPERGAGAQGDAVEGLLDRQERGQQQGLRRVPSRRRLHEPGALVGRRLDVAGWSRRGTPAAALQR